MTRKTALLIAAVIVIFSSITAQAQNSRWGVVVGGNYNKIHFKQQDIFAVDKGFGAYVSPYLCHISGTWLWFLRLAIAAAEKPKNIAHPSANKVIFFIDLRFLFLFLLNNKLFSSLQNHLQM